MRRCRILNQAGNDLGCALRKHWSAPDVLDIPPGSGSLADERWEHDVLILTGDRSWRDGGVARPAAWPGAVRWVQVTSTGVDWYPDWLFDGPLVTCTRGLFSAAISEYVMAAMLHQVSSAQHCKPKDSVHWTRCSRKTLQGQTVGLFGFGTIGKEIAIRADAFGMSIAALKATSWRPSGTLSTFQVAATKTLHELAERSDHLVLAAPLTSETRLVLDEKFFAHQRPNMHLINVARGRLVDHYHLLKALDEYRLAFATLDVADPEPLPAGHILYSHPKVRLTPHVSWLVEDGRKRLINRIIKNFECYLAGGQPSEIIDPAKGY